jgi:hypothetical protein
VGHTIQSPYHLNHLRHFWPGGPIKPFSEGIFFKRADSGLNKRVGLILLAGQGTGRQSQN